MTVVPDLEAANRQYASTFDKGSLALAPARYVPMLWIVRDFNTLKTNTRIIRQRILAHVRSKLFVLTCMDARLDPARFLGLQEGDAHVHRNAGGRAIEALRSIMISQQLLGTREIVVIHHTDCGMLTFRDDDLRDKIGDELGQDASHIAFLPFRDLHESVRQDVEFLKKSPLVLDVPVTGYIYDVKTGRLEKLEDV